MLLEEINQEKELRERELYLIKHTAQTNFKDKKRQFLLKYDILAIYAIWEGYFKEVLELYYDFISKFEENLIIDLIEQKCLNNSEKNKNIKIIKNINNQTHYNLDWKKLRGILSFNKTNEILDKLNLTNLETKSKTLLNNLTKQRNPIAHGTKVEMNDLLENINKYSNLVIRLMDEIYLIIEEKVKNLKYEKDCLKRTINNK